MKRLEARTNLKPVYPGSVFSTVEVSFGDGPQHSRKNPDAQYDTMEAITVCGRYDWQKRGRLVMWDDDVSVCLYPGTTVLFPTGTKRFSYVGVDADETFCMFRQFCHAGVLLWIENNFRSETELASDLSEEDFIAYQAERQDRPKRSMKNYIKIGDMFVF